MSPAAVGVSWHVFAPAKINLFLAVHGPRDDGFHDLTSLVAPLAFGDDLSLSLREGGEDVLRCEERALDVGPSNLVLRAVRLFRERVQVKESFDFSLNKRIPMGAGLGGGSSDGVAALSLLNAACGGRLGLEALREMAAALGSDCPLFLEKGAVVVRGRGECVEPVESAFYNGLRARYRVLLVKPAFGVATGPAYQALRECPAAYIGRAGAEDLLAQWKSCGRLTGEVFRNSFETVICRRYLALDLLLERMRSGVRGGFAAMSGSGSTCFALYPRDDPEAVQEVAAWVRTAAGEGVFMLDADFM